MTAIKTAEEAVNTAERFLERYHVFHKLIKVVRQDDTWLTEFDVGILVTQTVLIKLDAETGSILEYTTKKE